MKALYYFYIGNNVKYKKNIIFDTDTDEQYHFLRVNMSRESRIE